MHVRLIRIAGGLTLYFAVTHCAFWWLFDWSTTLDPLRDIDRGVMLALDIAVACTLFTLAGLSLLLPRDLLGTRIGRALAWSIVGFWVVRAVDEFLVFASPSVVLALVCTGVGLLYAVPLLRTTGENTLCPSTDAPTVPACERCSSAPVD